MPKDFALQLGSKNERIDGREAEARVGEQLVTGEGALKPGAVSALPRGLFTGGP